MIDSNNFLNFLYGKLPGVYKEEDEKIGLPLYRYLQALCLGGFSKVISDSNNFLDLVDPQKCPDYMLPYLYESFGLEYYKDIPIEYHRKFLSNVGLLLKRRGTPSSIRYLISTITGFEVDLSYRREYNEEEEREERVLEITLIVDSVEKAANAQVAVGVIEQFIKTQLPFYIIPKVIVSTAEVYYEYNYYTVVKMAYSQHTKIN